MDSEEGSLEGSQFFILYLMKYRISAQPAGYRTLADSAAGKYLLSGQSSSVRLDRGEPAGVRLMGDLE